ncbi:hypothetical protein ACSS6W_006380 [Trichoderma asperelloides]
MVIAAALYILLPSTSSAVPGAGSDGAARKTTSHVEECWEYAACETFACLDARVRTC